MYALLAFVKYVAWGVRRQTEVGEVARRDRSAHTALWLSHEMA